MFGPSVVFAERVPTPLWIRVCGFTSLLATVALIMLAVTLWSTVGASAGGVVGTISGLIGLVLCTVLCLSVATEVRVHADAVSFRCAPFRWTHIPLSELEDIHQETVTPLRFGGLGLRYLPHHERALLLSRGTAVSFLRRSDQSRFHLRTDRPAELIAALRSTH